MSVKDTSKPAFPREGGAYMQAQEGMSLRDYMAGQALAGALAQHALSCEQIAKDAYLFADAMLKEREK